MDSVSYLLAWCVYLLAALGLVCVFWRITRNFKLRRTRRSLRALAAVVLFTPINIGVSSTWLAPAYLVGSYDWVLGRTEKAIEAGFYISAAYALLIVVIMLESVIRRLLGLERA